MEHERKLRLNIKFKGNKVICARSPSECKECKEVKSCETIDTYYDPFKGINECFRNNDRRR